MVATGKGGVVMAAEVAGGTEHAPEMTTGTTWFVTRHEGAKEWARRRGIRARFVDHLDVEAIRLGDVVMGVLPVSLAAEVCDRGARFFHLSVEVPPELRGRELTADEMERLGAELIEYEVRCKGKQI